MKTSHLLLASAFALGWTAGVAAQEPQPLAPPAPEPEEIDEPADEPTPVAPSPAPVEPINVGPMYIGDDDTEEIAVARPISERGLLEGGIVALKVLGGTGDFIQEGPSGRTGLGPSWDVRGVFGVDSPVGLEAAYVGSTRALNGSTIAGGDQLMSNGAETDLRIAVPIRTSIQDVDVRPFAFGGVGWQYMTIWGDGRFDGPPETDNEGDNILTIPAGIGVEVGIGALNLDARGTYRHAVDSEIFGEADASWDDPNALHSFNISGGVGLEF